MKGIWRPCCKPPRLRYAARIGSGVMLVLSLLLTVSVGIRSAAGRELAQVPEPCDCSGDLYNCPNFSTHPEAQACYGFCMSAGFGDVHGLDGPDQDGLVCENLPGGPAVTPPATAPARTPASPPSNPTPPSKTPPPSRPTPPATTTYVVQEGDTLYSIAKRHGMSVEALMAANGLTSSDIWVGQTLRIGQSAPPEGGGYYTVVPGDTLYSIARRHGTTVEAIQRANHLTGTDIYVGQRLLIGPASAPGQTLTHTVVRGDTLYSIARRYGTTVELIMQANHLPNTNIYVGQLLHIPQPASPKPEHKPTHKPQASRTPIPPPTVTGSPTVTPTPTTTPTPTPTRTPTPTPTRIY